MYKKDNNYLEDEFDTLQNKVDCIENDYNDYCVELEKKINNLESTQLVILKSLNKNSINRNLINRISISIKSINRNTVKRISINKIFYK